MNKIIVPGGKMRGRRQNRQLGEGGRKGEGTLVALKHHNISLSGESLVTQTVMLLRGH